jgi:signal transduction histidine kinase
VLTWLQPPELDDPELAQRARIAHFVLQFCFVLILGMCVVYVFTPGMLINIVIGPPIWAMVLVAMALNRRGYVDLTAYLMVGANLVTFTIASFKAGGLEVSIPGLFALGAVLAAMMIGPRAGLLATLYGALVITATFVLGYDHEWTYSDHPLESSRYTTQLLVVVTVGVIVTWVVDQLNQALGQSRSRQVALENALTALDRSRAYSERMVAALGEAVVVSDAEGEVLEANPSAERLWRAHDISTTLVGRRMFELFDDLSEMDQQDTTIPARAEVRLAPIDGTEAIPVQLTRSLLTPPDAGASNIRWIYVASDIRHRIEAEERSAEAARAAEEASRSKSQFLANMSHELRTPLNAVIGYAEILSDDAEDPQTIEDTGRILEAGRHLLQLINDVLDMSKIEAGRMEIAWEQADVPALVEQVVQTVRPAADKNGTTLHVHVPDDLPTFGTDTRKLKQILLNLCSNAVKFTEKGEVHITVERLSNTTNLAELSFAIRDTGIGIRPDRLHQLFRPFVQGDGSTSRRFGGTGLGLALCKSFADMLKGRIEVESEEGVGSTFTLVVPEMRRRPRPIATIPPTTSLDRPS